MHLKLFLTVSLLLLSISTTVYSIHVFPFESHSFNDLDYIVQQLKRGIDAYKIDVSMADHDSCIHYSTWKSTDNPCEPLSFDTDICCLAFRGDASSAPIYNDYFNTTTDLVRLLNSTELDFILSKNKRLPQYNRTILMGFNIQEFAVSNLYTNWLYDMFTIIQRKNLSIIFLDASNIGASYKELCRVRNCTAKEQYLANYDWKLQCGISSNPQCFNFNIPFPELSDDCQHGFPTWVTNSPLFFYEFAEQTAILDVVNLYTSPKCNSPVIPNTLDNVRLTSNIDLEMLQAFLPRPSYVSYSNTQNNIIEPFIGNNSLLIFYNKNTSSSHIQVRSLNQADFFSLIYDLDLRGSGNITKATFDQNYLLFQNASGLYLFNTSFENNILALDFVYSIPMTNSMGIDLSIAQNGDPFVATLQISTNGCNGVLITIFDIGMDDQITNCINYSPAFDISEVINGDIEIAFQPFNPDVISGLVFISANHTYLNRKKPTIFGYAFNYSISLDNMNVYAPKSYLDFGAAPMLKFFKTNGTIYVLEAHTHSSAPCGTLINNADTFKCGVPNTKIGHKAMMQSVPYILNYNWGTFAAIQERILAGNFLGPCDKKVMHAKYGNGDFPDGIVYFNQTTQHLQALMVNQHIPFVDLPAFSKLFTGARVPDGPFVETLELNIFDVVDFDTLKIF